MPTEGFLLFAGLAKAGKTRLAASIPNATILELEIGGADRLGTEEHKISVQEIGDLQTFKEAMAWAIKEPSIHKIVIDTSDALLQLIEEDILERHGLGSMMERREGVNTWQEMTKIVNAMVKRFKTCGKLVIALSHFKASKLDSDGKLVVSSNIDAPGKIGPNLLAQADLIGNCSKSKVGNKTEYAVSFEGGGTLGTFGGRVDELEGKRVVIPKHGGWAAIEAACAEGALADAKPATKTAEKAAPAAEKQEPEIKPEAAASKAKPLSTSEKKKAAAAAGGAK